uniref:Endoplasmic reticulum transmembrane protein n=1 Tax=Schistocephalus solidus TaxID=70667 RepID=A0A0X3NIP1_SCHSO
MKLVWTLAAGFLYCEVFSVVFLLLPFISVKRWNAVFNSRAVRIVSSNASFYFNACIVLLTALFFESIRKIWTHSAALSELKRHPEDFNTETETIFLKRMFKAQRNLYISALSLFLCFVIHRLTKLIADQASMLADQQAASEALNCRSPPSASLAPGNQIVSSRQSLTRSGSLEEEIAELKAQIEITIEGKCTYSIAELGLI